MPLPRLTVESDVVRRECDNAEEKRERGTLLPANASAANSFFTALFRELGSAIGSSDFNFHKLRELYMARFSSRPQ